MYKKMSNRECRISNTEVDRNTYSLFDIKFLTLPDELMRGNFFKTFTATHETRINTYSIFHP